MLLAHRGNPFGDYGLHRLPCLGEFGPERHRNDCGSGTGRGLAFDVARCEFGSVGTAALPRGEPGGRKQQQQDQDRPLGHSGQQQQQEQRRHHDQRDLGNRGKLAENFGAELAIRRRAGDDDARRGRNDQRGHLRHNAVADRQQGILLQRLRPVEPALGDADDPAGDDVDHDDDDRGDRITLHELARAIHRAIERCLALDVLAPDLGFVLVDQPHVEVGVDRHLLSRNGIEREARGHFRNALGARRHHHKLDDNQDEEDDHADDVVALDRERSDRADHFARKAVCQDQPRRRDVERQPEQRRYQQQRRESRELHRPGDVERQHQDRQGEREIEHEQEIEHPGWNRGEQDQEDADHRADQQQVVVAADEAPDHRVRAFPTRSRRR